mgnify:CR=1 FL=1
MTTNLVKITSAGLIGGFIGNGVLGALFSLPFILFSMTGGYLADRYDARLLVVLPPLVTALAISLLGNAPSYPALAVLLLVAGASSAKRTRNSASSASRAASCRAALHPTLQSLTHQITDAHPRADASRETGAAARVLGCIAQQTPDLIILDFMLPGMDGLEVCHRLRSGGSIPIRSGSSSRPLRCWSISSGISPAASRASGPRSS